MGILNGEACIRLLLMIAWFNSLNSIFPLSIRTQNKDGDTNFNRDFTGVYFDPLDFKTYNALPHELDESALASIVEVIHTRFDKTLVTMHSRYIDGSFVNDQLPKVVAQQNQLLNDTQSSPLKVGIMYSIENLKNNENDDMWLRFAEFHRILGVVYGANSIFSGTVNSVILEIPDSNLNTTWIQDIQSYSTVLGTMVNKVGIKLKLETCVNASSSESMISRKFINDALNTDSIGIFLVEETFDRTIMSVSQVMKILESQFNLCKKLVHKLNKNIELALITTWSDTDDKGQAKFSEFVHFWMRVNKWAEASNTSVIFRQAFDTPLATGTLAMMTNGWWRLVPNSSYLQPSQFVFEEKASISHRDVTMGKSGGEEMAWLGEPAEFNRSTVGVHFNPFVLKSGFVHSVSEMETSLLTLIQQISTKFSKILMSTVLTDYNVFSPYFTPTRNKQILFSVPGLLAKLNRNQSDGAKNSMELLLAFDENTAENICRSASEANHLFLGTVTQLIYTPITLEEDTFLDGYSVLANISDKFSTLSFGMKINLEVCNDHLELRRVMGMLQDLFFDDMKLNVIYFDSLTITTKASRLRSDRFLPLLKVMFENCKKTVQDYLERSECNEKLEVAFITGWPIRSEEALEGLVQFTTFWEAINAWASTTNTKVILYSAFDPLVSSRSVGQREDKFGWWSARHNSTLAGQYSFEAKKMVAFRYASEKMANDGNDNDSSQLVTVIVTSVASVITILSLALLTVFYLLRRRQSNILTKAEIAQFLNGGESNVYTGSPENMNAPYQKLHLELPSKSFTINEGSPLGSGAYGKVCHGTVTRNGGDVEEVAVKMTNVPSTGFALRGLLFEIKILSYLGRHPHVVGLIGAYTTELCRSKVFVFLELCGLGSLQSFLRKYRSPNNQVSEVLPEQLDCGEVNTEVDDGMSNDMARWSCEIAKGMEFIASKHIVHLDIATRNILLTSEKRAKITDFGLSRRMYEYQSYTKKNQEPLPWRSMAPESLRRSEFTEKSDVWAFGILLWEIYSLGDEPYPGLSWGVNFPTELERGLRPGEPTYNRNGMYSIMLRCWTTNPAGRPTFSELGTLLSPVIIKAGSSGSNSTFEAPCHERDDEESTCAKPVPKTSDGDAERTHSRTLTNSIPRNIVKLCPIVGWMWSSLAVMLFLTLLVMLIWSPWMIGGLASSSTSSNATQPMAHRNLTRNQTSNIGDRNEPRKKVTEAGPWRMDCKDARNRTALGQKLFIAIGGRGNKEHAVSVLVQRGADLNVRDELDQTPLIAAANCDGDKIVCLRIIKILTENGANATAKDMQGQTFLYKLVSEPDTITPTQFHDIAVHLISKNMSEIFTDSVKSPRKFIGLLGKLDSEVDLPLWWLAVWNMEVENRTLSLLSKTMANISFETVEEKIQLLEIATLARRSPRLLSFLIELGADWSHLGSHNNSLLHLAAAHCYPELVNFYFHKGLDINAPMKLGFTPLHMAAVCSSGNMLETIQVIIDNGANANVKLHGGTPRSALEEQDYFPDKDKVVQLLRDAELDQELAIHRQSAGNGKMELGQLLLDAMDQRNEYTIRGLVRSGVDINKKDSQHMTPLMRLAKTCRWTCFKIMKYLINNGADVDARDMSGNTFLHHLIAHEIYVYSLKHRDGHDFHEIVSFAVANNFSKLFNVKERKFPNNSLIHSVLVNTRVDMDTLTLLYQSGVDLNSKNLEGDSALSSAVDGTRYDDNPTDLIYNLIKVGVDWSGIYKNNRSLLHISARAGNTYALGLFLNKESLDVNAKDSDGETPLHLAVRDVDEVELLRVVQLLIENDANVTIRNDHGKIPFSVACNRKLDIKVAELLKVVDCGNELCHPTKYGYCGDGETGN